MFKNGWKQMRQDIGKNMDILNVIVLKRFFKGKNIDKIILFEVSNIL